MVKYDLNEGILSYIRSRGGAKTHGMLGGRLFPAQGRSDFRGEEWLMDADIREGCRRFNSIRGSNFPRQWRS
jgi:hypothetical protein